MDFFGTSYQPAKIEHVNAQDTAITYKRLQTVTLPNLSKFGPFPPQIQTTITKDTSPLYTPGENKIPYGQETAIAIDVLRFHTTARQDPNLLGVDCQYPLDSTQLFPRCDFLQQQLFWDHKKRGGTCLLEKVAKKKASEK